VDVGYSERTADGMTPDEQLRMIAGIARRMVDDQYRCLLGEVIPALGRAGVHLLLNVDEATDDDRTFLREYFQRNVFPVLTPLAVDPAHPFPYISNLSISIAVFLRGTDGEERFARVKVPKILPRWVALPGTHRYLPLEQVIGAHLEALFPGVEILGWHAFRITRNTDLQIDHDEAEDLLSLIQEEVRNRRFAEISRLEVGAGTPVGLRQLLLAEFNAVDEPFEEPGLAPRHAPSASDEGAADDPLSLTGFGDELLDSPSPLASAATAGPESETPAVPLAPEQAEVLAGYMFEDEQGHDFRLGEPRKAPSAEDLQGLLKSYLEEAS